MKLIIFQRLVKLKLLAIKNINKDIQYLDRLFIQITKQLEYIFSINLISYHKYSLHLQTLENILLKFNNLPNIYTLKHKLSIKEIRNKIDYLNDKLIGLCILCGLNNIFDLIQ